MNRSCDHFLWVEKYRPKKLDDCILPQELKEMFAGMLEKGELANMLFTGTAGLGKTTVAKALCEELGYDYIMINGSEDSGIDVLRTKIRQFASTTSIMDGESKHKVVILDEADYLNPQSTQPALRGFIEEFSANCRFILTCNHRNRVIAPLHSRCNVIEFTTSKKILAGLCPAFFKRLTFILDQEGITYDRKALVELISKYAPDWRKVIGECQRFATAYGEINSAAIVNVTDVDLSTLMKSLKEKDFKTMRQWVANNMDVEAPALFRKIYDNMAEYSSPASIPQIVLILADYQYKNAFVADHELNVVACMTELMAEVTWK